MKKLESRLAIIDEHISKLEKIAVADANSESSALMQQLRKLREDIKSKAKKDYLEVQSNVLNSFRTLMEQLTTLSFYASEAEEDSHSIEKVISQLNKLKTTISENVLGLKPEEKESEQTTASAETETEEEKEEEDEIRAYIESKNGKFFTSYADWYSACMDKNLKIDISGSTVSAFNENGECLGKYVTTDMNGCLFDTVEDYDKALEDVDDEEIETEDEDELNE